MNKIKRKFPVFISLLFAGTVLISFDVFVSEYWNTFSVITGFLSGLVVTIAELIAHHKNCVNIYSPTLLPYKVFYTLVLINVISIKYGGFMAISPGVYLITLAIIFKIYELKTKNNWITWNELLD